MVEEPVKEEPQTENEMSDEEALMKIAQAMKGDAQSSDEKQNVHTFLYNVATAEDTTKLGNLSVEKDSDELGKPEFTVRGCKSMALISKEIIENEYFENYFRQEAEDTLATSLSNGGFLVKQGTTQTKQVADITKRRKVNKGWFGSEKVEETGGDTTTNN